MITAQRTALYALGFIALMAACVLLVLLAGIGTEPCMEFDGWRWESVFPKPSHCRTMGE